MRTALLGSFEVQFSYNQLLIYDVSVAVPECEWTEDHVRQGFARRISNICLGTILQGGTARIRVYHGPYVQQDRYHRVIATPFYSPQGKVVVSGLLEIHIAHLVQLGPGHYRLVSAQTLVDEAQEREHIDLFFVPEDVPSSQSEILLGEPDSSPPTPLLEDADELVA
jgi:hypothetical protein